MKMKKFFQYRARNHGQKLEWSKFGMSALPKWVNICKTSKGCWGNDKLI